ncbi:hypothetical protein cyc_06560 [Cyclospora cayetanensis]|uniref:Uncharacterized protein n=1 Tax=Cyclospora cayetanensis TaxID=88456 RepID=A0A1D3D3E3_9EIME|nr:hypothetical protein cyc_06560 [Cyclospora cayetanensis]
MHEQQQPFEQQSLHPHALGPGQRQGVLCFMEDSPVAGPRAHGNSISGALDATVCRASNLAPAACLQHMGKQQRLWLCEKRSQRSEYTVQNGTVAHDAGAQRFHRPLSTSPDDKNTHSSFDGDSTATGDAYSCAVSGA